MRRTLLLSGLVTCGLAFGVTVQPADAQSIDLNSSMTATCVGVGLSCDVIDFVLDVDGEMFMKDVTLFGDATWSFMSLVQVWSQGNPVVWNQSIGTDGGFLLASDGEGNFDPEVLRLRVTMATWGNASQLSQIFYTANGFATETGPDGFFSTEGNVAVPEPVSTLLLSTGLLGFAGVVARRRKDGFEEGAGQA